MAMAHGYSSDSDQKDISNEYHYDRVYIVFNNFVVWRKVASALEGLTKLSLHISCDSFVHFIYYMYLTYVWKRPQDTHFKMVHLEWMHLPTQIVHNFQKHTFLFFISSDITILKCIFEGSWS